METINVVEQGCIIKKSDVRFLIYKEGIIKEYIPYYTIKKIILWGNQNVTSGAFELAFEKGIDIIFLSFNGRLKGKVEGAKGKDIYIRLAQYELWREPISRLEFGKNIIINKIENQYRFLKKYDVIDSSLLECISKVNECNDSNELIGIEGIASKIYFSRFNEILKSDLKFNGRNRRPPKDEINALLSLTYSILLSYLIVELEIRGIDPYLGFIHSIRYGRESLALDILEEFRVTICDKFVVKLINRKEFKSSDFNFSEENGMRFKESSFRKYLEKFNKELPIWQKIISEQVIKLKKSILGKEKYEPYSI